MQNVCDLYIWEGGPGRAMEDSTGEVDDTTENWLDMLVGFGTSGKEVEPGFITVPYRIST